MSLNYLWWIKIFLGAVAIIILQWVMNIIIKRVGKKNHPGWKASVGKISRLPLSVLIGVLGALYFIDLLGDRFDFSIPVAYLEAFRKTAVAGCGIWIFYRWKQEIEHSLMVNPSKKIDITTVHIISRLVTIAVGALSGLVILQIFGINTAPLLAFGSIGAASIGLAAKDVIANFCSGLMLHMARPFVIGDQIVLPEKNIEGQVEDIGWLKTSLRDKEKRPVYLPNSFFSTMLLVNVSRMSHRHIKQILRIGFKNLKKVGQIVEEIRAHLEKCPQIDTHYPLHVFLKSFGDYACEIEIEAYSPVIDQNAFNRLQHQILLELQAILEKLGVQLAIPTMQWTPLDL